MPKKKSKPMEDEGPRKKTIYTIKLEDDLMDRLADRLEEDNSGLWFPYDVAYSLFAFKGDKVNVAGYQSGKLVVSGKNTEEFVRDILEAEITGDPRLGYDEVHNPEWFELHAGCDESGKGELFGPLVTACVIADGDMVRQWLELGVADSKKLTDGSILKLDREIRKTKGVDALKEFAKMHFKTAYEAQGLEPPTKPAWHRY